MTPARSALGPSPQPPPGPTTVCFRAAARYWLELGLISFGGPAGQVALMHSEVVERRRWLSERRFLHALNYAMVLPGPEAQQLATYIGWLMHGIPGGLVAGSLFILPSLLLLILLSAIYASWGQLPLLVAVFWALKPAVTAIVIQAAWRLGRRTLHNKALLLLALLAFAGLTLLRLPFPLIIAAAALAGWLGGRWRPRLFSPPGGAGHGSGPLDAGAQPEVPELPPLHGDTTPTPEHARFDRRRLALILLAGLLALALPLAALSSFGGWDGLLATMARFFSRVALLSFGGAYAVLPYVAQGAVEQHQWLGATQMIDGLALGETTPGPLIMVVTFVGFMGGWNTASANPLPLAVLAALTVTWFTFLPSFLFILAGGPLVEASRGDIRLSGPLTAITAAVVGVIANLAVFFAGHVLWPQGMGGRFDPLALALIVLAAWLLIARRWPVLRLIAAAALVGLLTSPLQS
ncbi:chromate efflux transporter [Synechococcus sp. CS-1325]|uniref:chromate efflux transporter n=1 Tax=Synechococcus sp. CS-1325 TaxID=2847979 RepID=UPI000DB53DB8|nr:chromate efflux transporter [Synechococcus sp. CS-1325]MCT0199023.1 chromate efflux transporter [Synechococcus sp. CS-1325]PZV00374.1 MAG: chromate transporter [Cyanobium sp.]